MIVVGTRCKGDRCMVGQEGDEERDRFSGAGKGAAESGACKRVFSAPTQLHTTPKKRLRADLCMLTRSRSPSATLISTYQLVSED